MKGPLSKDSHLVVSYVQPARRRSNPKRMLQEDDADEDIDVADIDDEVDDDVDVEPAAELDDDVDLDSIIAGAGRQSKTASAKGIRPKCSKAGDSHYSKLCSPPQVPQCLLPAPMQKPLTLFPMRKHVGRSELCSTLRTALPMREFATQASVLFCSILSQLCLSPTVRACLW